MLAARVLPSLLRRSMPSVAVSASRTFSSCTAAAASESFLRAKDAIKDLPERPGNDVMLQLYALFKQATEGANKSPAPGMMDFVVSRRGVCVAPKCHLPAGALRSEVLSAQRCCAVAAGQGQVVCVA
tara:strand:- start:471 stop:851 length:381 start_codon:yes stop_codon:yes gene_type:complete